MEAPTHFLLLDSRNANIDENTLFLTKALAQFERTLISADSKYDRYFSEFGFVSTDILFFAIYCAVYHLVTSIQSLLKESNMNQVTYYCYTLMGITSNIYSIIIPDRV